MMITTLIELLAMYAPAIAAIVGILVTAIKTIHRMEDVCARTKREELYAVMKQIEQDDKRIKKMLCETIDAMKKINGYAEVKYDEIKDDKEV